MNIILMKFQITKLLDGYLRQKLFGEFFSFDLFNISPSIISLKLHVENSQLVTYNETDDLSEVINKDFIQ